MDDRRTLQQDRIAKGLCPRCGEQAAPYRLCSKHRFEASLARGLNKAAAAGIVEKETKGGRVYWSGFVGAENIPADFVWQDYKGRKPRIGGVPVDVGLEAMAILKQMGRPASEEEIATAFGKLRADKKRPSFGPDVARLVEAERKRAAKRAKAQGSATHD